MQRKKRRLDPPAPSPEPSEPADDSDPDPEDEPEEFAAASNLSSLVLRKWAWGYMHATEAHEYLLAGYKDGLSSVPEIAKVAQMGAWGSQPGSVHRALTTAYLKGNTFPEAEVASIPCQRPKTLEVFDKEFCFILPHDSFAALFHHHRDEFQHYFGIQDLGKFWSGASRNRLLVNNARARAHPIQQGSEEGKRVGKERRGGVEYRMPAWRGGKGTEEGKGGGGKGVGRERKGSGGVDAYTCRYARKPCTRIASPPKERS